MNSPRLRFHRLLLLVIASIVLSVSAKAQEPATPRVRIWQAGERASSPAERVRAIVEELGWKTREIGPDDIAASNPDTLPDLLVFPDGTATLDPALTAPLAALFQRGVSMMVVGDATFGRTPFDGGGLQFPRDGARRRPQEPVGVSPDKIDFFDHALVSGEGTRIVADRHSLLAGDWKERPAPERVSRIPRLLESPFLRGNRVQTRFLPVLRQVDAKGADLGPVAAVLHNYGGLYKGASFGYWGLLDDDPLANKEDRAVFRRMLLDLTRKLELAEFLPDAYWWTDEDEVSISARIFNLGHRPAKAEAKGGIYNEKGELVGALGGQRFEAPPGGEINLRWDTDPSTLPEGLYQLKLVLKSDDKIIASHTAEAKKISERTLRVGEKGFSTAGEWRPYRTALVADPQAGDCRAEWRIPVPRTSLYDVFALWRTGGAERESGGGRRDEGNAAPVGYAPMATYIIRGANGEARVEKTQRWVDGVWVYLGTFPFTKKEGAIVQLSGSPGGSVCAEAVRIRRTDQPACPDHGVIRPDDNGRYFVFEDGTPFMPVGVNYGAFYWDSGEVWDYASEVERYFQRSQDYGINLTRFWLRRWDYSDLSDVWFRAGVHTTILMDRAQQLHDILYLAEKYGIYLNIVLGDKTPVVSEDANLREKMERAIVEEFGGSRMIFSWDFFNDYQKSNPLTPIEELREIYSQYESKPHMKNFQLGDYQNARTSTNWTPELARLADFTTTRAYSNEEMGSHPEKIANLLVERIEDQYAKFPDKPVVSAEYGPIPSDTRWPQDEITHEWLILYGLWEGMAGGATPAWRWSSTFMGDFPDMSPKEYQPFRAVSDFVKRVPWGEFNSRPCREELQAGNPELLIAACRDDKRLIGFLSQLDPERTYGNLDGALTIQSALTGPATLEWIEPWTGDIVKTETIRSFPAEVKIPAIHRAAAFYVRPEAEK